MAKGLLAEGIRFGDRVAIMSRTRYEWTLFDFALWSIGAQSVPVYPTSSSEQVRWMLHDSDAVAAIVEHEDHAMTIGAAIDELPHLTRLWQLDSDCVDELTQAGRHLGDDVVERHRLAVTPDAVATIIYTSGTTGRPKGCVLTHANFMAETDNVVARWEPVFASKPSEEPSTLLFLPLAHVFGRMVEVGCIRHRVTARAPAEHDGHRPHPGPGRLPADLRARRAVRLREGLPGRPPQGRGERQARPVRQGGGRRGPARGGDGGQGVRHRAGPERRRCGCSTSSTTSWSTARCATRSAAGCGTASRAARRWSASSACSSPAPA